jgi:hypothetical protein
MSKKTRLERLGDILECMLEKHKLIRRSLVVWSVAITTMIVLRITDPQVIGQLDVNAASVLVPVIALIQGILLQYIHQRGKPNGSTERSRISEGESSDSS